MDTYQPIRELIAAVRRRWRLLRLFRSTIRGAAGASAMLGAGLLAAQWSSRSPMALMTIVVASVALAVAALVWALAPLRHVPSDRRVARFIEEGDPALDDRLVTACGPPRGEFGVGQEEERDRDPGDDVGAEDRAADEREEPPRPVEQERSWTSSSGWRALINGASGKDLGRDLVQPAARCAGAFAGPLRGGRRSA